jgi:hypothetical protein
MKKHILLSLGIVAILATGCPVGLDHPLDEPNANKIDKELLGTWESESESAEVKSVTISEASSTQYNIEVHEHGEMYVLETDKLIGWTTTLAGAKFVYLKPDNEEKFYHYQYKFDGQQLITNDVSLLEGGVDAVTSTKALRDQVEKSMKSDEWATETQTWHKK